MKKICCFLFLIFNCCTSQETKINGISYVASERPVGAENITPVKHLNANWVTLMPFGFMKTTTATEIIYNSKRQWYGETTEGIEQATSSFHQKKIKVMLKPQIWIPNGGFTGHIKMNSENDWLGFEKNYEAFLLNFAVIAQKNSIELFCIGTELHQFVANRPEFWTQLIIKIKSIYKGKITYAENWDTFEKVPFVSELDFIGVDAYFPLSEEKTATVSEIETKWQPIKAKLESFSVLHKKPILFTEFGYQSRDFTSLEPWKHNEISLVNLKAQENALQAIFKQFWQEDWFAGGFLWKWYDDYPNVGGVTDQDYTIQNKPSEELVRKWYGEWK
jgi:hypothetical protein